MTEAASSQTVPPEGMQAASSQIRPPPPQKASPSSRSGSNEETQTAYSQTKLAPPKRWLGSPIGAETQIASTAGYLSGESFEMSVFNADVEAVSGQMGSPTTTRPGLPSRRRLSAERQTESLTPVEVEPGSNPEFAAVVFSQSKLVNVVEQLDRTVTKQSEMLHIRGDGLDAQHQSTVKRLDELEASLAQGSVESVQKLRREVYSKLASALQPTGSAGARGAMNPAGNALGTSAAQVLLSQMVEDLRVEYDRLKAARMEAVDSQSAALTQKLSAFESGLDRRQKDIEDKMRTLFARANKTQKLPTPARFQRPPPPPPRNQAIVDPEMSTSPPEGGAEQATQQRDGTQAEGKLESASESIPAAQPLTMPVEHSVDGETVKSITEPCRPNAVELDQLRGQSAATASIAAAALDKEVAARMAELEEKLRSTEAQLEAAAATAEREQQSLKGQLATEKAERLEQQAVRQSVLVDGPAEGTGKLRECLLDIRSQRASVRSDPSWVPSPL